MLSSSPAARAGARRRIALVLGAAVWCYCAPTLGAAGRAPPPGSGLAEWNAPPEVATSAVATRIRIDGVQSEIRQLHSALPPDRVAELWRTRSAAHSIAGLETRAAQWRVLSFRHGTDLLTVQLRRAPSGGTVGYAALAHLGSDAQTSRRATAPLALPAGARVLRTVESLDRSRVAVQIVIATGLTARVALEALARRANAARWRPASPFDASTRPAAPPSGGEHGLWFARGAEELAIFVQSQGAGALAVVHHVRDHRGAREAW